MIEPHKKIVVLAIVPGIIPSTIINIIEPLLELQNQGKIVFKLALSRLFRTKSLADVDVVVFCRNAAPYELKALQAVVRSKIPCIYDIDDNFFAISAASDLGKLHRCPASLYVHEKYLRLASLVRVYNPLMEALALQYNKIVMPFRPYLDLALLNNVSLQTHKKIRIVYATSRREKDVVQKVFVEALREIALKYQDQIEIFFWGCEIESDELEKLSNVFRLTPVGNYRKFMQRFCEMSFDIGLAPALDVGFHNSKTNTKYRDFGSCKIAGVYSNVILYSNCVQDGVNGLLVNSDTASWFNAIEKLILNSELRETIKRNAYSDVKQNYSFTANVLDWERCINLTHEARSPVSSHALNYVINLLPGFVWHKDIPLLTCLNDIDLVISIDAHRAYAFGIRNFMAYIRDESDLERLTKTNFYRDAVYVVLCQSNLQGKIQQKFSNNSVRIFVISDVQDDFYREASSNVYLRQLKYLHDEVFLESKVDLFRLVFIAKKMTNRLKELFGKGRFASCFEKAILALWTLIKVNYFGKY